MKIKSLSAAFLSLSIILYIQSCPNNNSSDLIRSEKYKITTPVEKTTTKVGEKQIDPLARLDRKNAAQKKKETIKSPDEIALNNWNYAIKIATLASFSGQQNIFSIELLKKNTFGKKQYAH